MQRLMRPNEGRGLVKPPNQSIDKFRNIRYFYQKKEPLWQMKIKMI